MGMKDGVGDRVEDKGGDRAVLWGAGIMSTGSPLSLGKDLSSITWPKNG